MRQKRKFYLLPLWMLAAICLAVIPAEAWALGADHPNDEPVGGSSAWPDGLKELVNIPQRAHGYFVNAEDVFFFSGNTDKLNEFLEHYKMLPKSKFQIVLHRGFPKVMSPWDEQPRNVAADWKLYTAARLELDDRGEKADAKLKSFTFVTRLDIWTGLQIDLDQLQVAAELPVEAAREDKDDPRIKQFVAGHWQNQIKPPSAKQVEK